MTDDFTNNERSVNNQDSPPLDPLTVVHSTQAVTIENGQLSELSQESLAISLRYVFLIQQQPTDARGGEVND